MTRHQLTQPVCGRNGYQASTFLNRLFFNLLRRHSKTTTQLIHMQQISARACSICKSIGHTAATCFCAWCGQNNLPLKWQVLDLRCYGKYSEGHSGFKKKPRQKVECRRPKWATYLQNEVVNKVMKSANDDKPIQHYPNDFFVFVVLILLQAYTNFDYLDLPTTNFWDLTKQANNAHKFYIDFMTLDSAISWKQWVCVTFWLPIVSISKDLFMAFF